MVLAGCKKEGVGTKITALDFKKGMYEINENEDINLFKELVTTPEGIKDTCKVTWKVSDPDVAEMDGKYLIPTQPGDVKVTATVQNISATCKVSILSVPVESITLEDMDVPLNRSVMIKCTTEPSVSIKRISFTSSDNEIATIGSDGMVEGKKEGTATITAKVDGKEDDCTVKVSFKKVEKVVVTPATHKFSKKGETVTLKATIEPADASYPEIKWSTNDPSVAVVDETTGVVTSTGGGKAIIKATAVKDDVSGQCEVETPKAGVTSVTISTGEIRTTDQSFTQTLTVEIKPESAADLPVKWTAKGMANVDANGKISVTGGGYGVVYAEVEGIKDSCEVYVKDIHWYLTDCKGNKYFTTVINGQEWMAENLRCDTYDTNSPKKGVEIPTNVTDNIYTPYYFDGKNYAGGGTNCFTSNNRNHFGYSYNWAAAVGVDRGDAANTSLPAKPQGICPNGWHVSTKEDWETLFANINRPLRTQYIAYLKMYEYYSDAFRNLISTTGWCGYDNLFDAFDFGALPVGKGGHDYLNQFGVNGYFWLPTTRKGTEPVNAYADCAIFKDGNSVIYLMESNDKALTASVRCVKN